MDLETLVISGRGRGLITKSSEPPLATRGAANMVHRASATVRTLDKKERTVRVICSTDAVDSYGDVVEQKWNLARYAANPVVLYAHNGRELPIGCSEDVAIVKGDSGRDQLEATIRFASEKANPFAEQVFQCFAEGLIRGVSVGFMPRTVRYEKRDGKDVYVLTDNELHELSVTPVPANPEALAKSANTDPTAPRAPENDSMLTQKDFDDLVAKHADALKLQAEAHDKALAAQKGVHDAAIAEVSGKLEKSEAALALETSARVAAEAKSLDTEIKGLVGKKILPVEVETFTELAKSNRPLFDKMLASRTDLKLLGAPVIGDDAASAKRETQTETSADGGADFVREATERAAKL